MILAGGTGGHVYPALAVARELMAGGHEVVWMGTRAGLEARVVPAAGIPMEWLTVAGLRGKGLRSQLSAPFMLARACRQAYAALRRIRPQVVLGMGGFVAGPGGLMARWLGIPLVLHEQNRIPGTTNRWLAGRAQALLEAFPGSFPARLRARWAGNPLRPEIAALARGRDHLPHDPPHILVVGGSLGAKALNELVPEALARTGLPVRILHQSGTLLLEETRARYARLGLEARVEPFLEQMAEAYAWADLAVCRAGAMTISELAAAGLPAILIPYPFAIDDHQTHNARYLAEAGAALLLPQSTLTVERLAAELGALLRDPARRRAMAERAAALAKPEAAGTVAAVCLAEARP
ncbi:N-acetylglucosaminyl transferase [Candidatus Methylocalor cossyra]|uniref:UDP-N-acetylglucosamine--N-acetylmuramyl-(pentapeptide) pyrophosphoryl-undecaprenol N-acetylglucosamine transferase n=2 Tax=Candidatus Methylocalor cossyra TaxID=3108543 RepID=A0ABM9NHV8_9GAMM